jgi:hypothetical protein
VLVALVDAAAAGVWAKVFDAIKRLATAAALIAVTRNMDITVIPQKNEKRFFRPTVPNIRSSESAAAATDAGCGTGGWNGIGAGVAG